MLAAVLFIAVTIMASYHFWSIACAETSVESQDHEQYRKIAKGRGEDFVNSYDLGYVLRSTSRLPFYVLFLVRSKRKNLELFFNIGKDG